MKPVHTDALDVTIELNEMAKRTSEDYKNIKNHCKNLMSTDITINDELKMALVNCKTKLDSINEQIVMDKLNNMNTIIKNYQSI